MILLGKTTVPEADTFAQGEPSVVLGSLSAGGLRRVFTNAVGGELDSQRERFAKIAVSQPANGKPAVEVIPQFKCVHRGSKRHTCCDSPELWICKQNGADCVANDREAMRLQSMVGTDEAKSVRSCESCPDRSDPSRRQISVSLGHAGVAVVIPCHNYARFLAECIESLMSSTVRPSQIIVVDDSSDDDPKSVCDQFEGVEYIRCEERDVHATRGVGLQRVNSRFVCFLDADDKVLPEYFAEALEVFNSDRRVAIAFPQLVYFGDATGPAHGTDRSPEIVTFENIEQRNWISAGAVLRTELVHQSLVFRGLKIDAEKCWTQDWRVAKSILRSGASWIAKKMSTPLLYRKHGTNMSARPNDSYWYDADFSNETITIVIAFSGRWDCWPRLRAWLKSQTWPVTQLRLMIINATHKPLTASMLGLQDWEGSLQIERLDAGYPRLADQERRNQPAVGRAVEAAVAAIYNTAIRLLGTEYVVFIEDDVVPRSADTVEQLLKAMGPWVSAVSGVYRQRYQVDKCCAFDVPFVGDESFKPLSGEGIELVGGSGFGCLLTRRSLLRRFPLAGDGAGKFFDCDFSLNCSSADNGWWTWLLNRNVQCDHLVADGIGEDVNLTVQAGVGDCAIAPVAFDYGGTLRVSDGVPALRDLVHRLNQAGVPVIIVSAISEGYPTEGIEQEIRNLKSSTGESLHFESVQFVYYPYPYTEQDIYEAGLKKAAVMQKFGANVMLDDSGHVCKAVNDSGLLAVRIAAN